MAGHTKLSAAATLVFLTTACAFTPVKSPYMPSARIGEGANAEVRVGVASREVALTVLGKPSYSSQHDLAVGYLFAAKIGTAKGVLMGPCSPYIGSTDVFDDDDVWLAFDEQGTLKRVEKHLVKKHHGDSEAAWRSFAASVPDTLRPEQMLNGLP
jgi:hypothetical protein